MIAFTPAALAFVLPVMGFACRTLVFARRTMEFRRRTMAVEFRMKEIMARATVFASCAMVFVSSALASSVCAAASVSRGRIPVSCALVGTGAVYWKVMPLSSTPLDYQRAGGKRHIKQSVRPYAAGLATYAAVASAIWALNMSVLGQWVQRAVGIGGVHEGLGWTIAVGYVAFVIYMHRLRRWTGFSWGVATGAVITLAGAGLLMLFFAVSMRDF